jgi:hypothetical protein
MQYRILGLVVAVAALVLALGSVSVAADKKDKNTHTGTLVSVTGNDFTMTAKGKEHKHTLAADAKVTCDGKTCKLDDLKAGTTIAVTTREGDNRMATRVVATTKSSASKDNKDNK